MKHSIKKWVALSLSAVVAFAAVGCKKPPQGEKKFDNETTPVVFSIQPLDMNFNPFFATSATDAEIAGMTQIGMLTSDKNGNPTCGDNEPTVALDYKITYYDKKVGGSVIPQGTTTGRSEYEFLIKNGIKFSDGTPLTMDDILFNLYVYLDPLYAGSATVYSTDIQGLKAYRAQDPSISDDDNSDIEATFVADARIRVSNIISYVEDDGELTDEIEEDIKTVHKLFREELTRDWTANVGMCESMRKDRYNFTEDWQTYFFNEGIISPLYNDATGKKIESDKVNEEGLTYYKTSLDYDEVYNPTPTDYAAEFETAIEENLADYMAENKCDEDVARELIIKDTAIDIAFESYSAESNLPNILRYWATSTNALNAFIADERTEYFKGQETADGKLIVPSISGIDGSIKTKTFDGVKNGKVNLDEDHSVLKIVVNGVDPKAIWNFAFSVAPMNYYSNADAIANKDGHSPFGVVFSDGHFMNEVVGAAEKTALPKGAGVYKASSFNGQNVTGKTFCENNFVHYERNEYFHTVGKELSNAKIKYIKYKVTGDENIMSALEQGGIDFGYPQATVKNIGDLDKMPNLAYKRWETAGYGYVGINPKYVPDIEIRRAIMMSFQQSLIIDNYYTSQLAQPVYLPMSTTSWAYPESYKGSGKNAHPYYGIGTKETIEAEVAKAENWEKGSDGIWFNSETGKKLELTFTIAGASTDHPAFDMFTQSAQLLNRCGFDVKVTTSPTALQQLNTGKLAVWAAAWGSAIDPDMFQIYHKDSKALSVNNWNYPGILSDTTGQFAEEQGIIEELSDKIDQARTVTAQSARAAYYEEALDLIMQLAVEFPTYQRNDLAVYNKNKINANTLNPVPTANEGIISRIWELDLL